MAQPLDDERLQRVTSVLNANSRPSNIIGGSLDAILIVLFTFLRKEYLTALKRKPCTNKKIKREMYVCRIAYANIAYLCAVYQSWTVGLPFIIVEYQFFYTDAC